LPTDLRRASTTPRLNFGLPQPQRPPDKGGRESALPNAASPTRRHSPIQRIVSDHRTVTGLTPRAIQPNRGEVPRLGLAIHLRTERALLVCSSPRASRRFTVLACPAHALASS
jgi:hypothetical protein